MLDKYEIRTQYIPALLCSAPFVALGIYYISQLDDLFVNSVAAQAAGGITMSVALYFLMAFTCRHIGKFIEDRMFSSGKRFPTTTFLLANDTNVSDERKQEIYAKIKKDFNIDLAEKTGGADTGNQRIHEAIGHIRQRFWKKNEIVLLRNIQYGFSRNLAGGSLLAEVISLGLLLLAIATDQQQAVNVSIFLALAYLMLTSYGLLAMWSNAKRYAHTLFDEFLAS